MALNTNHSSNVTTLFIKEKKEKCNWNYFILIILLITLVVIVGTIIIYIKRYRMKYIQQLEERQTYSLDDSDFTLEEIDFPEKKKVRRYYSILSVSIVFV